MNISFKAWIEGESIVAGSAPPGIDNPQLKSARQQAVGAASQAANKKKDPVKAAKNALMKAVTGGTLALKDLPKLMPTDGEEE